RQITVQDEVLTLFLYFGAFERHLRVLRRVEEIRGFQVCLPCSHASVNAVDLRGEFDRRFGDTLVVEIYRSLEILETALDEGDLQMPDAEADHAVCGIEVVSPGGDR